MASKYQKTPFNKEKLLKMALIIAQKEDGQTVDVLYSELKLSVINGQICFVTTDDYFMPIARITTIETILEKSK